MSNVAGYRVDPISEGGFLVGAAGSDGSVAAIRACSTAEEAVNFIFTKLAPCTSKATDLEAAREQRASGALADDMCSNPNCWCQRPASAALAR